MKDFTEISYVIDPADRLVSVSEQWPEFARQNDSPDLTPESVLGRTLWDFITDDPTRDLYAAILDRVRKGSETDLVLRCDAPERRRLIEMTVKLQENGNVAFRTVLLAAKDRAIQRLLDRSVARSGARVMICSWCDRVNAGGDDWLEVEAAMEKLNLTNEAKLPSLDPVVCPACFAKVTEILTGSAPLQEVETDPVAK